MAPGGSHDLQLWAKSGLCRETLFSMKRCSRESLYHLELEWLRACA